MDLDDDDVDVMAGEMVGGGRDASSPFPTTMVSLVMQDVHECSLGLFEYLERANPDTQVAAAGMVLTLGRMASPKVLEVDQEIEFIRAAMDFVAMWFGAVGSKAN